MRFMLSYTLTPTDVNRDRRRNGVIVESDDQDSAVAKQGRPVLHIATNVSCGVVGETRTKRLVGSWR